MSGGDTDGDGKDDLLVGCLRANGPAGYSGAGYLFTDLSSGSYTSADADAVFWGEAADDSLGEAVILGDIDGDSYPEVILGAPYEDSGGSSSGAVYAQWP